MPLTDLLLALTLILMFLRRRRGVLARSQVLRAGSGETRGQSAAGLPAAARG